MPLRGLLRGGPAGGDKLCVPPPQGDAAHVQHRQRHAVPGQQHHQPGHVRGVPHQHAGLDDPLAGAQQGQGAPRGLHTGQRGHGHHDGHEHCPVLPATQERLSEEVQDQGDQERQGDVERRGRKGHSEGLDSQTHSLLYVNTLWLRFGTVLLVCHILKAGRRRDLSVCCTVQVHAYKV